MRRHVVTTFLLHRESHKVLLLKRSGKVSTYQGHWAAVSGGIEPQDSSPELRALTEITEELGLTFDQFKITRRGKPLLVDDGDKHFKVFPFLAELCTHPSSVRLDWEHVDLSWVHIDQLTFNMDLPTVPRLVETFERVYLNPELEAALKSIQEDRRMGAREMALFCLNVLQGQLETVSPWIDQLAFRHCLNSAWHMSVCRPAMAASIVSALGGALSEMESLLREPIGPISKLQMQEVVREYESRLISKAENIVKSAADHILNLTQQSSKPLTLFTLSRSSTVVSVIRQLAHFKSLHVVVAESRPLCEGAQMAQDVAKDLIDVKWTVITEAQIPSTFQRLNASDSCLTLLGCDSIYLDSCLPEKSFISNKVGSWIIVSFSKRFSVPVLFLADQGKVISQAVNTYLDWPLVDHTLEEENSTTELRLFDASGRLKFDLSADNIQETNAYFDKIPFGDLSNAAWANDEGVDDISLETLKRVWEHKSRCFESFTKLS